MTKIFSNRKCKYINFFYYTQVYREKFSISNSKVCVLSSILIVSRKQWSVSRNGSRSVPSQPSRFCPSVKMTRILSCGGISTCLQTPLSILPISVASSPATTITLCKVALDRLRMTTIVANARHIVTQFFDIPPNAYDMLRCSHTHSTYRIRGRNRDIHTLVHISTPIWGQTL